LRNIKYFLEKISFGNKIFIFNAIIFIIALFLLAFFANSVSTSAIMAKAKNSSSRELKLIERNLKSMTESIEDYSRMISSENRLQQTLYSIYVNKKNNVEENELETMKLNSLMSSIVSNIIAPSTQLVGSSIVIDDETVYSGYNLGKFDAYQVLGADYLKAVSAVNKPVWSGVFPLVYDTGTVKNVYAVGKVIIDKDTGVNTGTAIIFVDEVNISKIYLENRANDDDRFYILDSYGMVISSDEKSSLYRPAVEITQISNNEYDRLLETGSMIVTNDKTQFLYSVQEYEDLGWSIVSIISLDEILQENKNISKVLIAVTLVCLLMAFALSYFISNRLVNPIIRLTKTTQKIIKGDMSVRAKTDVGGEVGILTKGFNDLMDRIESLIEEVRLEHEKQRETEFKLIQSQISPHFLYNTLETINSFITLGMMENATKTVSSLSQFYRISLSKGDDVISIHNEMKIIKSYLNIQKFRYNDFLDFEINIDKKILGYSIPKLTLQPIVENAIYHGLKNKKEKGKLEIKGYFIDEEIVLEVADNGIGMPQELVSTVLGYEESSSKGYGLSNVNNRLKLLYGSKGRLEIKSVLNEYTKVYVHIMPTVL